MFWGTVRETYATRCSTSGADPNAFLCVFWNSPICLPNRCNYLCHPHCRNHFKGSCQDLHLSAHLSAWDCIFWFILSNECHRFLYQAKPLVPHHMIYEKLKKSLHLCWVGRGWVCRPYPSRISRVVPTKQRTAKTTWEDLLGCFSQKIRKVMDGLPTPFYKKVILRYSKEFIQHIESRHLCHGVSKRTHKRAHSLDRHSLAGRHGAITPSMTIVPCLSRMHCSCICSPTSSWPPTVTPSIWAHAPSTVCPPFTDRILLCYFGDPPGC